MKIFIGCSSSDEVSDEYKVVTKYLAECISKDNDLVFGCANRGLMGICYNEFLNNKRNITGICYEMYKDDLKDLTLNDIIMVNNLEDSMRTLQEKSDLIIFLPGAFGTLSEFMYILESKRTKLHNKDIIIFNINGFFDDLINLLNNVNKKISKDYDFSKLCKVFNSVDNITNYINSKKEL